MNTLVPDWKFCRSSIQSSISFEFMGKIYVTGQDGEIVEHPRAEKMPSPNINRILGQGADKRSDIGTPDPILRQSFIEWINMFPFFKGAKAVAPVPRRALNKECLLLRQPLNVFIDRLAGDSKSLCRKPDDILRVVFDLIEDELPDLFTAFAHIDYRMIPAN